MEIIPEMTFENVLKATIFVKDMGQFANINSVYGAYFNNDGFITSCSCRLC